VATAGQFILTPKYPAEKFYCFYTFEGLILKKLLTAAFLTCAGPTFADDFLDTQYGPFGWEVHLLRATIANDVLTIAFMIENTGSSAESMDSMDVSEVAYTTSDEQNEDGNLFRAPGISQNAIYFSKEERQVGWVKFEAPGDADWPIDLSLPGVSPFTIANPAD